MKKDPRRPLLAIGLVLLAASAVSLFTPLQWLAPWLLLAGAVLVLLWAVVRKLAVTPVTSRRAPESTLFKQSTTMDMSPDDKRED